MYRKLFLASLAMAAAGLIASAEAQQKAKAKAEPDKWVLLGSRQVDLKLDKDTIGLGRAQGVFKAVRLEAKEGNVLVSRIQVDYKGQPTHNEDRTINLLEGERTRPVNPTKDGRELDKVTILYKSDPKATRRSVVEVWGLQTAASAPPVAAAPDKPKQVVTKDGDKAISGPVGIAPTSPTKSQAQVGDQTALGVLFGVQRVGFGVDRDVIRVGKEIGKFDRIRLRVLENDIRINELKVIYENGEPDTLAVAADVKQNTRTAWLNLKGDRFISEIQMSYRSRPSFKGQAVIEVYGDYAAGWLGPQGEGRKFNQGWVLLGAQTADFIGFDKDVIPVGRNEGGFKQIRVTVRDRAITLNELRVLFENNKEQVLPIKQRVDAGSTYGPIKLEGGSRIREIQARYRSRVIDTTAKGKGRGIVEIWGQH